MSSMSHGKSLRLLAGGALLAAVAYAAFVHFERRTHDAAALDPALERELAEGFYGEGKLTQAFDLLSRIAARPDATAQDLANLACIYFQQAEDPGALPAERKEDEAT